MNKFLPWGNLEWVLDRLDNRNWSFLGCLSHEPRCYEALKLIAGSANNITLVRIFDDDPVSKDVEKSSLDDASQLAKQLTSDRVNILDSDLLASIDKIEEVFNKSSEDASAIIIDITSFPKRWFFFIARMINESPKIADVIYTYAPGSKYADVLAFNPEIVRTLPTFTSIDRRQTCDVALVGIGFHSYSILNLFDIEKPKAISMLFPFPPGPPGIRRNWRFVERIEGSIKVNADERIGPELEGVARVHVGALDLPQNFHALRRLTDNGALTSLVAPYGPKPVSLAMCLFALAAEASGKAEVPAYYAQPTRYALNYTGTGGAKGSPVYAYPTRLASRDLYTL